MIDHEYLFSHENVTRAAKILIEVAGGPSDEAIELAKRQLEMSLVKPFASAVLEEVRRLCADPPLYH